MSACALSFLLSLTTCVYTSSLLRSLMSLSLSAKPLLYRSYRQTFMCVCVCVYLFIHACVCVRVGGR